MDANFKLSVSPLSDIYKPFHSVLIVDDNPETIHLIGDYIASEQPNTLVVACLYPEKVFEIMNWIYFDVILTDMEMPVCPGYDFICKVQRISPATAFLAMTGCGSDYIIRAGLAGVQPENFFVKPFNLDVLSNRIIERLQEVERMRKIFFNILSKSGRHVRHKKHLSINKLGYPFRIYSLMRNRINAIALLNLNLNISKADIADLAGYSSYQRMCVSLQFINKHMSLS